MPHADYKLITAANMRPKVSRNKKKTKRFLQRMNMNDLTDKSELIRI